MKRLLKTGSNKGMRKYHLETTEDEKVSKLTQVVKEEALSHGFDYATFTIWNLPDAMAFWASTYPTEWLDFYSSKGFQHHDPVTHVAIRATAPVDWEQAKPFDTHGIFKHFENWGIASRGVSIPVRGAYGEYAILSACKKCSDETWENLKRAQLQSFEATAIDIHKIALQTWNISARYGFENLNERESEILQLTAYGKSNKEISRETSLSGRIVENALASAREKLSALNTNQAVARAIGLQLISPA